MPTDSIREMQVARAQGAERAARAWVALLHAHTALTRAFNADLHANHGLTVTDFEVMRHLDGAPGGHMRRVDIAQRVGLTPSGVTRLLEGLHASGFVAKADCPEDARFTYATITPAGRRALKAAARTHLAAIHALFAERFADDEAEALAELLERLPRAGDGGSCPHAAV
jgi:DNA-binding MarR family transcriptional regulator